MLFAMLLAMTRPMDREDGNGAAGAEAEQGGAEIIEVPIAEDGAAADDTQEDSDAEPATPARAPAGGEQTPRRQRRNDRYKELLEANRRLEASNTELSRSMQATQLQLAEMRGALSAMPRGPAGPTPEQSRVRQIREQRAALNTEYYALPDDQRAARHKEFQDKQDELEDQLVLAIHATRPQQQPDMEQTAREIRISELSQENPDIFGNPTARAQAQAFLVEETGVNKKPLTRELWNDIFERTRKKLGMPTRSTALPTQGQRVATSGRRGGNDAAGESGHSVSVPWDENTEAMARAAFPNIKDAAARKTAWIKRYVKQTLADRQQQ